MKKQFIKKGSVFFIICFVTISCTKKERKEGVFINEILSNNTCINYDPHFNNYSDWIELYNGYSEQKNISGWEIKVGKKRQKSWFIPKPNWYMRPRLKLARATKCCTHSPETCILLTFQ